MIDTKKNKRVRTTEITEAYRPRDYRLYKSICKEYCISPRNIDADFYAHWNIILKH